MRYFLVVYFILLCFSKAGEVDSPEKINYFKELVFKSEFREKESFVRKWETDVNIYISSGFPLALSKELDAILVELNNCLQVIKLKKTNDLRRADLKVLAGTVKDFLKIEPKASPYATRSNGLFWLHWSKYGRILWGSVFINLEKSNSIEKQKHVLREELTQALGIMNDSNKYKDSIFYQNNSQVTSYSELDKKIIKLLYSKNIKPGMTKADVSKLLSKTLPLLK